VLEKKDTSKNNPEKAAPVKDKGPIKPKKSFSISAKCVQKSRAIIYILVVVIVFLLLILGYVSMRRLGYFMGTEKRETYMQNRKLRKEAKVKAKEKRRHDKKTRLYKDDSKHIELPTSGRSSSRNISRSKKDDLKEVSIPISNYKS
jgi:hypothetical protein